MTDREYMALALELAGKGCGSVNPNPMVGAVIVKDNRIIGQGYHEKYGQLHAERNALASCSESPEGATMYVTLEPCCHWGQTPPCTEAIIENKLAKVVIASKDPNPLVGGKGIEILKNAGIEIDFGLMEEEALKLNEVFFHYIRTNTPFVLMKYAMTADGKIATHTGESKWITGPEAREHVHYTRNKYMGIMVGIGTVLADDPLLNCRIPDGRNPVRIICDTALRLPAESQIVKTAGEYRTIIATCCTDAAKQAPYIEAGCEIMTVHKKDGHLNLAELMKKLGKEKIDGILLEGGGTLNWSALNAGIVNKVQTYIAPKIFGGTGKTPVIGKGVDYPSQCIQLSEPQITFYGKDILLESEVLTCSQE